MPSRLRSPFFSTRVLAPIVGGALGAYVLSVSPRAEAQAFVPPERSDGWNDATTIMAVSALGLQLIMPRIFYSDPEVTAGWKARWHLSALAPVMTLATLSLVNQHYLKQSFEGHRPGCEEAPPGEPACSSFGMFSTQSFAAFGALGQGTGVFLIDTIKWSDGRFNAGAFTGQVGLPLVLAVLTAVGRGAGNWESGGQVWASAGVGVLLGMGTGLTYALLQRPECGYTGSLLCW